MWGTIAGAAIGLGGGIAGAIRARKEARRQRRELKKQQAAEKEWYARNYYQNYLDSAEAQSAIKRVNDTINRRNEQNAAAAKINGSTPEAVMAAQDANNELLSGTISGLAQQGMDRRNQVDMAHMQNQQQLSAQAQNMAAAGQQGASTLVGSSAGLIGSALSLLDGGGKSAPATSAATTAATKKEV